jgi:hypothetical protein
MKAETSKIQLDISDDRISVSDRMPIRFLDTAFFLLLTSILAIFFLGAVGVIYSLLFSLGYALFRYFAWLIWKRIVIDLVHHKLTDTRMLLNSPRSSETITTKFDIAHLEFHEFEQSGMKRAMIRYRTHKEHNLLLLTHKKDIAIIDEWLSKAKQTVNTADASVF